MSTRALATRAAAPSCTFAAVGVASSPFIFFARLSACTRTPVFGIFSIISSSVMCIDTLPLLAAFENMPHMAMLCIVRSIATMMAMRMARLKRTCVTRDTAAGLLKTGYTGLVPVTGATSRYDVTKPPIAMMKAPRVITSVERTTGHGKGGTKPPKLGILADSQICASSSSADMTLAEEARQRPLGAQESSWSRAAATGADL